MSFVPETFDRIIHPDDADKPAPEQRSMTVLGRMNMGQRARFMNEVAAIGRVYGACSNAHFDMLLLTHNVTSWAGPGYSNVKLSAEKIMELDFDDALVALTVATLTLANRPRTPTTIDPDDQAAPLVLADADDDPLEHLMRERGITVPARPGAPIAAADLAGEDGAV